jgi:hypothetical protein
LLEAWKTLTRRRDDFSTGFAQPILTAFVEEVHDNEDLPLPAGAPDFVDARAAYSRARWMGPGRGWVDPVAEKKAPFLVWMPVFPPSRLRWVKTSVKTGKKCLISAREKLSHV